MTKSVLLRLSAALLLLSAGALAVADNAEAHLSGSPWSFSVSGLRTYWFGVVPAGADVVLQYRGVTLASGLGTVFEEDFGAGYQQNVFFRNADGTPLAGSDDNTFFPQLEIVSDTGIRQGIIWSASLDRNLAEAFAFYRLHFDRNFDTGNGAYIFASSFPDRVQILSNAALIGLDFDTTRMDSIHKTWDGFYAEASVALGPRSLLNGIGDSSYARLNLTAYGFTTLLRSSTADGRNLTSIYLGDFATVDYAAGSSIPIYVMQTVGGRYPRNGVGDAVRGFEAGAYDTNLKAVNNLEVRVTGPALIWPNLVPGLYAFFDSGFHNGYSGDPSATVGGFLASGGVGLYFDVFDIANATALIAWPLTAIGNERMSFTVASHFHLQF